jgi:hypothetical protein
MAADTSIIPSTFTGDLIPADQHPLASEINGFLKNQSGYTGEFSPTGLKRTDYLRTIEKITRAMVKYQNSSGQIVDPIKGREFQYSTPCFAHAVSVLCGSGFLQDQTLLQAGIKAMDASIKHMLNNDCPDGHGDFFTVPMMLAFWNYKSVIDASKYSSWRTDLGKINTSAVYRGLAPNWIGINTTGEFLRYKEGLTSITYVQDRILHQLQRMNKDGTYQDSYAPETTLTVPNTDGNSLPYDNVARAVLGIIATNGYQGNYYQDLRTKVCQADAAINYELWAAEYAKAGKPLIAGAFKRAAMLSLKCVGSWHRSDGSGYIAKARYPIESQWGYILICRIHSTISGLPLRWLWHGNTATAPFRRRRLRVTSEDLSVKSFPDLKKCSPTQAALTSSTMSGVIMHIIRPDCSGSTSKPVIRN